MKNLTFYRTAQIDGLSIFYRESGPKDAPTILLLHGLPSSSRMFEPLFTNLPYTKAEEAQAHQLMVDMFDLVLPAKVSQEMVDK
ncbi:MAG: alpha/beta fold hydrolase, partial [Terriglobales bacterium]